MSVFQSIIECDDSEFEMNEKKYGGKLVAKGIAIKQLYTKKIFIKIFLIYFNS